MSTVPSSQPHTLQPEEWVQEYGDYLYGFALARVKTPELAQDIVQEAFLSAWKAKDSFKGQAKEKTWLTTILRNKIIDHYRRSGKDSEVLSGLPVSDDESDPDFNSWGVWKHFVPNWADQPDQVVENEEFIRVFQMCSQKLPQNLVAVFQLKYVENLDSDKICEELGISPSNLWTTMYRMRIALRQCLDKNWYKKRR